MVPVMVGSKIIDKALGVMTKGDLEKAATIWRQAHFGAVMSGSLQLSHTNPSKIGMEEEVSYSSHGSDPVEVWKLPWWYKWSSPHHTGHYTTIWHSQCACQYQCQRTLYSGSCTHGTNTRSPVASSSGTNCNLQGIASWVLKGTHLPAQLEHPYHGNTHKGCGWTGCPSNQVPLVVHPNQDYWRDT